MKQKYITIIIFIIALIINFSSWSQTTLNPNDVAITSFNADGNDEFSFVLLKNITAGTVIYFTENGWDDDANGGGVAPTWGNINEGTLTWTSTSAMSSGTEIQVITPKLNATLKVNVGSIIKSGTWALGPAGDAIIIYQGTSKPVDGTEVTNFIWVFNTGSSGFVSDATSTSKTGIPTGLSLGIDAIYAGSADNFQYNCSTLGPTSSLSTALATPANFTGSTTITYKASGCSYYDATINTWAGSSDSNWSNSGNWSGGVPTNASTVSIPNITIKPIINAVTNALVNNLTVDASSSLTVNGGGSLSISSNLTNNGTFTINSDTTSSGSLIVSGTATGNVTYNRYLTSASSSKWHLISAPIGSQSINSFVTTTANNIATSGVNYSVTPYNNTVVKTNAAVWTHWTSDATKPVSGAGNFVAGKGYEILTTADGTVAFTGTVPVANVSIAITKPASGNAWNLIGNPYPSSIFANNNADATNNFITVNTSVMDANFVALYLWNPTTSIYDKIINNASSATYIAPGQGFFVKSKSGGATVNFKTAMRTNQPTVAFQRAATQPAPSITLIADNGNSVKATTIKYMGGMHLGLDPGYDAGRFGGVSTNFDVFSHLVNDNGVDFALQVLPDNVYDITVIPIGIDAKAGTKITFKANVTNLPIGKKVFLEDRLLGLFNELTNNKTYAVNIAKDTNGIGRFFLRTLDNLSTLGVNDFNKLNFSLIAQPKLNSIRVIGNIEQPASLNIYDTLGRLIKNIKLKDATDQTVKVSNMSTGIYILKINAQNSRFSTKIAWY